MKYQVGDMLKYESETESGACVVTEVIKYNSYKVHWLSYSFNPDEPQKPFFLDSVYRVMYLDNPKWSKLS